MWKAWNLQKRHPSLARRYQTITVDNDVNCSWCKLLSMLVVACVNIYCNCYINEMLVLLSSAFFFFLATHFLFEQTLLYHTFLHSLAHESKDISYIIGRPYYIFKTFYRFNFSVLKENIYLLRSLIKFSIIVSSVVTISWTSTTSYLINIYIVRSGSSFNLGNDRKHKALTDVSSNKHEK